MKQKSRIYPRIAAYFLILIFLLAYLYTGQIYVALGPSMEPTMYSGERIVIDKRAYEVVKPSANDIVALITPYEGRLYVKRVVAEVSDEVEIDSNGILVNSKLLANTQGPWPAKKFVLENDEVFVLGDNRFNSDDSRNFGPIKIEKIIGEVKAVVWPPSSWRLVK